MAANASLALWQSGSLRNRTSSSKLLFGRMFEDWTLESSLFPPGGKVLCIASAGCTTLELAARGHLVDAVDINPAQIRYLKERLSGMPLREGTVDRYLRKCRRLLSWNGPDEKELEEFLLLKDPQEQIHFWNTRVMCGIRGKLIDIALDRSVLQLFYHRKFLETLPKNFGQVIRKRLERSFSNHPNRTNNFAWRLILDRELPEHPARAPITIAPRLLCADVVHFLESCAPDRYDGFSLSNILDGAESDYATKLWAAVHRAARPGAVIVLRSFQEPTNDSERSWASQDRSMLWGRIQICKRESICSTV